MLVMLAIGCYEAPDYSGTHFKCDDMHACPAGQTCMNGFCSGGGSGSGMPDAPTQANGVKCGAETCSGTQQCCVDFISGIACTAVGAQCNGFSATCDGKEDCGTGVCCGNSATIAC